MHSLLEEINSLSAVNSKTCACCSFLSEIKAFINAIPQTEQIIFSIIEWQNISNINCVVPEDAILRLADMREFIVTRIDCSGVLSLGIDKLVLAVRSCDPLKHDANMNKLYRDCLIYGTTLKPSMLFNFKAGSAQRKSFDLKDVMHALSALSESKLSKSENHKYFDSKDLSFKAQNDASHLASYLINALNEGRYRLAFQAVINAKTGDVGHYEALLRLITEDGSPISAGPFINAAERFGFMDFVDGVVLRSVLDELRRDESVHIAMNISRSTTRNSEWINELKNALPDFDTASRLILEVTETVEQSDMQALVKFAEQVKWFGCQVAIDDFGAGYTSFKQLKLVNIDYLKIDGVFIRNIADSYDSKLFVGLLVKFARAYGIKTVAEYVETGEIAKVLIELGIDYMQGYYFSQALNYRPWISNDHK